MMILMQNLILLSEKHVVGMSMNRMQERNFVLFF